MPAMPTPEQLAAIAHDLRAPLTVITGTAAALRRSAPEPLHIALDKILTEAHRLGRMLENRVAAARLQADVALEREWTPIEDLAGAALLRLEASLAAHRVEL